MYKLPGRIVPISFASEKHVSTFALASPNNKNKRGNKNMINREEQNNLLMKGLVIAWMAVVAVWLL